MLHNKRCHCNEKPEQCNEEQPPQATLTLENGKKIEITAPKNSDDNRYVQKMTYNGKNYTKNYLDHFELLKGARLGYEMGSQPATNRGVNDSDFPYSFSNSAE